MSPTPIQIGDNPWYPGITSDVYVPDQLIAGNLKLVTENEARIAPTDVALPRGTVMGQIKASGLWVPSVATATDGSELPSGVLVDTVKVSSNVQVTGVYVMGEFNANAITFDPTFGDNLSTALPALNAASRTFGLFFKTAISAADPT